MDASTAVPRPVAATLLSELGAVPFLAAADGAATAELLPHVRVQTFLPGSSVVRQGEPPDGLWVVLSGRLALTVGPQARLVSLRGRHELLGEAVLLASARWPFDATATDDVAAVLVPRATLQRWVADHPPAAAWLLGHLARRIVSPEPIDRHAGAPPDVGARVAGALLALAERHTVGGVVRHAQPAAARGARRCLARGREQGTRGARAAVLRGGCVILDEQALRDRSRT